MRTGERNSVEPKTIPDRDLAREIETQGDDLSMWAEKAVKVEVAELPGTRFSVRFEYAELVLLDAGARAAGTTITEFIRSAALARARESASEDAAASPSR